MGKQGEERPGGHRPLGPPPSPHLPALNCFCSLCLALTLLVTVRSPPALAAAATPPARRATASRAREAARVREGRMVGGEWEKDGDGSGGKWAEEVRRRGRPSTAPLSFFHSARAAVRASVPRSCASPTHSQPNTRRHGVRPCGPRAGPVPDGGEWDERRAGAAVEKGEATNFCVAAAGVGRARSAHRRAGGGDCTHAAHGWIADRRLRLMTWVRRPARAAVVPPPAPIRADTCGARGAPPAGGG